MPVRKVKIIEKMPLHWFERVINGELTKWSFKKATPYDIEIAAVDIECEGEEGIVLRCPVQNIFRYPDGRKEREHQVQILDTEIEKVRELWKKFPPVKKETTKPQAALGLKLEPAKSFLF